MMRSWRYAAAFCLDGVIRERCIEKDVDTNFAHVVLCYELRIEMDHCVYLPTFIYSLCLWNQVPFIGMYRREECLDLLREPTSEYDDKDWLRNPSLQHHEVCLVYLFLILSIGVGNILSAMSLKYLWCEQLSLCDVCSHFWLAHFCSA